VPPGSPEEEALSDEEGDVPPPDEEDEGEDTDEGDDNPPGGGPRRTAPPGRKLPASGKPPLGNTSGPHDYASTQYNLPPRASRRVGKLAAMIEEEDLAGDGREDTPHVTVRYGLLSDEPAKALALAARLGPVHATLGEVKVFSSSANTVSDDSAAGLVTPTDSPDVVYIEVGSPLLHKLNRQLKQAYPHVEKYREYRPHVTLAYVKPGTGAKYAGPCTLTGLSFDLHDFVFSTRGGKKSYLHDGVSNVFCPT
jgi:2'-5' RNA ligase